VQAGTTLADADIREGKAPLVKRQGASYVQRHVAADSDPFVCGCSWSRIFRPRRQVLRMGIDSLVVLTLYVLGTAGLIAVARG
jgi:cation:H+ antiporter